MGELCTITIFDNVNNKNAYTDQVSGFYDGYGLAYKWIELGYKWDDIVYNYMFSEESKDGYFANAGCNYQHTLCLKESAKKGLLNLTVRSKRDDNQGLGKPLKKFKSYIEAL